MRRPCWRVGQRVQQQGGSGSGAMAAPAGGDVDAALKEVEKAAKKQKVCAASSGQAVDQLLQVGSVGGRGGACIRRARAAGLPARVLMHTCGSRALTRNCTRSRMARWSALHWQVDSSRHAAVGKHLTLLHTLLLQALERARTRLAEPGTSPQVRPSSCCTALPPCRLYPTCG